MIGRAVLTEPQNPSPRLRHSSGGTELLSAGVFSWSEPAVAKPPWACARHGVAVVCMALEEMHELVSSSTQLPV